MPPKSAKGQSKVNVDKLAWKWAETTDPADIRQEHLELAYRVNLKRCDHTGQRRNCKGNPMCLIGLGEKEWLGEIADENWHDIEDPETERRTKNLFVGLKNLGATCYVNSLLQVWFHNPIFRAAIYQYEEEPPTSEKDVSPDPQTICGHLQLVFALLEKSTRRYIDPTPFINSLGLDTMQQQDAQEFSKLFISLLEDTLSSQMNPFVRNIVQELFSGEYAYVTRCTKCGNVSKRPSKFYELDLNIKGHKDLHQCLEEFLKEEKLEGDNQYMCHTCQSKQNAGRKIALTHLPRVLNLQLLRFVFDRNTGHKKKLNTCIQFPEEIDMSQYLDHDVENAEPYKYDLKAVLIHRGPTAYSGHYIAHIKDKKNTVWYKFNDEEVEKVKGNNLQLGNEEEIELNPDDAAKPSKKPRLVKGTHASKNAYMLVYYKKPDELGQAKDAIGPDIPVSVQERVAKDNISFEEWCREMIEMRDRNVATGKAKQEDMKNMYQKLQLTKDCDYEWLSAEWLSKWLTDVDNAKKIENTASLCVHNKLNPDIVTKFKCVNATGADLLYSKYDGGPRLTTDMLCMDCIRERCRGIRLKTKTAEDSLFIAAALKNFTPEGTCYWVGKESLRSWKKMALEQLNSNESLTNGQTQETSENGLGSENTESHKNDSSIKPENDSLKAEDGLETSSDDRSCVAVRSHNFSPPACSEADGTISEVKGRGAGDMASKVEGHDSKSLPVENVIEMDLKELSLNADVKSSGGVSRIEKGSSNDVEHSVQKSTGERSQKLINDSVRHSCTSTDLKTSKDSEKPSSDDKYTSPDGDKKTSQVVEGDKEEEEEDEEDESFAFNEDLLCEEHGKLCTQAAERRLVSEEVWKRLKSYFPDAPEYLETSDPCEDCTAKALEEARAKEDSKALAAEQKQSLPDLYHGKARPKLYTSQTELYVVNNVFLESWRKFIRNPSRGDRTTNLNNSILLCDHDKLTFQPETMDTSDPCDDNAVTLLNPTEWEVLLRYVTIDKTVTVLPVKQEDNSTILITYPEVCDECIAMRLSAANFERMDYKNAKIYVQKLSPGSDFAPAENGEGSNSANSSDREDPEFSESGAKKRKRPSGDGPNPVPEEVIPAKVTRGSNASIRRSSRHRKVRGEKILTVDSSHTLRDLKLQLMKLFSVAPFDQHLMLNGKKLTDQNATLASLGVLPESVLKLKVDEPMDGAYLIEEIPSSSAPEEGFKGTGLLAGR